jgi:hypothetical protein
VPYTLRNNDILLIEGRNYSPTKFVEQIKLDFDQLYAEAGQRRRHDVDQRARPISGTPQMVRAWDTFLDYARSHPGVAFMRKTTSRASRCAARQRCAKPKRSTGSPSPLTSEGPA